MEIRREYVFFSQSVNRSGIIDEGVETFSLVVSFKFLYLNGEQF